MFNVGDFTSHSGLSLSWKIECDSLTNEDWDTLAKIVADQYHFKKVTGVPTGGTKFALALEKYCREDAHIHLITDDVLTTGKSMIEARSKIDNGEVYVGVVVFSRMREYEVPIWIYPIFTLNSDFI